MIQDRERARESVKSELLIELGKCAWEIQNSLSRVASSSFPKKKRIYASRCFSVVMLVPMLPFAPRFTENTTHTSTLIHVSDVLARTTACAFLAGS